jgi:hypothetical protein
LPRIGRETEACELHGEMPNAALTMIANPLHARPLPSVPARDSGNLSAL